MSLSKAALAVVCGVAFSCAPALSEVTPRSLTLPQAFAYTLERHPDLRRLPMQQAAITADVELATQSPAVVAGATLENAAGTNDYRGLDGAELSLTLASVFERGDKREARVELARSRLAGLEAEAEARRLDLLAEVARRYLDALAAQAELEATTASVEQRRATVVAARRRVEAGASPAAVSLGAQAQLARAELDQARARESGRAARRGLALMWGQGDPDFDRLQGNLGALPEVPEFTELAARLRDTPELQRFAGESRLREARLQLARSQSRTDLDWQVGLRRMQGSADWALLGAVSMPLGSRQRAQPGIRAAQAELDALALERESGEISLRATLADAHGRLRSETLVVRRTDEDVLPALQRAEASAGAAYRAGALSYLEWSQLQADLLQARRDRTDAAREFHRALIEIQRLTAQPFVLATGATTDSTP